MDSPGPERASSPRMRRARLDQKPRVAVFRRLMQEKRWNEVDLADLTGVSRQTIERLLQGKYVRRDTADAIEKALASHVQEPLFEQHPLVVDPVAETDVGSVQLPDIDGPQEPGNKPTETSPAEVKTPNLAVAIMMMRQGRFNEAFHAFLLLAEANNPAAQNHLGWIYQHGLGLPQDNLESVKWYRRAAELGDSCGQSNLGWMYEHGLGVVRDLAAALHWHLLAAKQGNGLSMNQLGWMYQNGQGVQQDAAEAFRWYKASAETGNRDGQNNLGWVYEHGLGVPRDLQEAIQWYRKAVELGNPHARDNLLKVTKSP